MVNIPILLLYTCFYTSYLWSLGVWFMALFYPQKNRTMNQYEGTNPLENNRKPENPISMGIFS